MITRKYISATFCILGLALATFLFSQASPSPQPATAMAGCEGDCKKCHKANVESVKKAFAKGLPSVKVHDVVEGKVRGLWEVRVSTASDESEQPTGYLLTDYSLRHVIIGTVVDLGGNGTTAKSAQQGRDERLTGLAKKVDTSKTLVIGNRNAPRKIVLFTDPDCSWCAKQHAEAVRVVSKRSDIAFTIQFLPLDMHPDAFWKAQSMLCSGPEGLRLMEKNFEKKDAIRRPTSGCSRAELEAMIGRAKDIGITGTPTMVFPDGNVHRGFLPAEEILKRVYPSATILDELSWY